MLLHLRRLVCRTAAADTLLHLRRFAWRTAAAAALALLLVGEARAQLRPLDPLSWSALEPGRTVELRVGGGAYGGVRASLAGVEGRLWEIGTVGLTWRTGRIGLEVSGTTVRVFEDESVFASPAPGTRAPDGGRRVDVGDWRIGTVVRLTGEGAPAMAVLRFGTRLPTTDNRLGLERDHTDFFALLGGRAARGGATLAAEAGVSINGTRERDFEQADLLVYALHASWRRGWFEPRLTLVGQKDGFKGWEIRGNEDLRELRWGVRVGRRLWLEAAGVTGFTRMGPETGLRLEAGVLLGHSASPAGVQPIPAAADSRGGPP